MAGITFLPECSQGSLAHHPWWLQLLMAVTSFISWLAGNISFLTYVVLGSDLTSLCLSLPIYEKIIIIIVTLVCYEKSVIIKAKPSEKTYQIVTTTDVFLINIKCSGINKPVWSDLGIYVPNWSQAAPTVTQNAGIRETMNTAANSNSYLMFDWTIESVSRHNAELVL